MPSVDPSRSQPADLLDEKALAPLSAWDPWNAWRIARAYGPLAAAVHELNAFLTRSEQSRNSPISRSTEPLRILQVGGEPDLLQLFLKQTGQANGFEGCNYDVTYAGTDAEKLSVFGEQFAFAVAIDWLPSLAPSQRQNAVRRLCQLGRHAVLFANAFDAPQTHAAVRAVNELYRSTHNEDHPLLGRQLEYGLPQADLVREWIAPSFPSIASRSVDSVALWQAAESIAAIAGRYGEEPSARDVAAAATYANLFPTQHAEHGYWTLITATAQSMDNGPPEAISQGPINESGIAVTLMHHMFEGSLQRGAIDRLTQAITVERQRERAEFRTTVALLAEQLRDLDARARIPLTRIARAGSGFSRSRRRNRHAGADCTGLTGRA